MMMNERRFFHTILLLMLASAFAPSSSAQTGITAQVSGFVRDPAMGNVTNATVTATNPDTGWQRRVTTDSAGYLLPDLPPGRYALHVEASGFVSPQDRHLELTVGQQVTIHLQLQLEGTHEEITVTEEVPVIETSRTELSEAIEERRIENLPINGRQFLDFALLTPNVAQGRSAVGSTSRPSEPNQINISFGGLPEIAGLITVDGANNMNGVFARPRSTPSQEGVREFRVLTNSYGADIGPAAGAVVNIVTKSGGNDLHGSLYEYFRNDALDAHNVLAAPGFDELRQNQFGATLGGRLVKDKVFYFLNYEGQRRNESPFYSSVLLDNLPAINAVKASLGLPPEVLTGKIRQSNYDTELARIDYQISGANQFSSTFRYRDEPTLNIGAAGLQFSAPSDFRNSFIQDLSTTSNLTTTFSSKLVNQMMFQFARRTFDLPSVTYEPHLSINNTLDLGRHFSAPDGMRENRFELGDSLSWILGSHNLRIGGDADITQDTFLLDITDPAQVIFPNIDAFLGTLPFSPGVPFAVAFSWQTGPDGELPTPTGYKSSATSAFANLHEQSANLGLFSLFVQDNWRVSPNFTLNYGLRWEGLKYPNDIVNSYYRGFLPRASLAYNFHQDRVVFRAGAGEYQGLNDVIHLLASRIVGAPSSFGPIVSGFSTHDGGVLNPLLIGPDVSIPAFLTYFNSGGAVYPPSVPGQTGNFILATNKYEPRPVYSYQWNASLEFRLGSDTSFLLGYAGVRGLSIPTGNNFNVAPAHLKLPDGENDYAVAPGIPAPAVKNAYVSPLSIFFNQDGQSTYHALNAVLTKRFSHHVAGSATYTFSRTMDDAGSDSFADDPQDPYNRHLERARSKQDVPQRLTVSLTGDSPFTSRFLKEFRLSLLTTAESAHFYTIYAGLEKNNDGNTVTDRPDLLGRNTYRGDNLLTVDLRLSRVFQLTERFHLEGIAEGFNLANRLNVTDLNSVYGSTSIVGQTPQHYGDGISAPLSTFGSIQATTPPRQLQLALKLTF